MEESPAQTPKRTARGALKIVVRVVVGAGVFAILLARTDLGKLVHQLSMAKPGFIIAGVALFFAGLGISALRWREYLIALEYPMPFGTLYRLYFVGTFFNAFLPTGVGGDAYKAVRLGRARGRMPEAFASVFLDRFAGIVGIAGIGLVASLVRLAQHDDARVFRSIVKGGVPVSLLALIVSLGILALSALILGPGERLLGRGRLVPRHGWGEKARRLVRGVHQAGRHPRAAVAGFALGFAFQAVVVVFHWLLAQALGIKSVPFLGYSALVVGAAVAVLIPLSIGGLGFQEGVYIWILEAYHVKPSLATAFAVLVRAVMLASSATGGIVYLVFGGDVAPAERPNVESQA